MVSERALGVLPSGNKRKVWNWVRMNIRKLINTSQEKRQLNGLASAWDLESQNFLQQFNFTYNKIASAMIVYDDLLKVVASEKNIHLYHRFKYAR